MNSLSVYLAAAGLTGCGTSIASSHPQEQQIVRPNVLWLVAEDISSYLPPFGDSTVKTPNLSRLAEEGVRYTNVFDVSGVCAPSRAAIITGMYPSSIGAHQMRTLTQVPAAKAVGLIDYECVPPSGVKMVSELLRSKGYYCSNNSKEDYQFQPSKMGWDDSSGYAHWRNRTKGQPFFAVLNFDVTHESQIWNPVYQKYDQPSFPPRRGEKAVPNNLGKTVPKPLFVPEDLKVDVPPYLPNTAVVQKDFRRLYSNIVEMDKHVGVVLKQLERDGLLDETIIVWYSDNGGPLPRGKRLLYDSGIKIPMIIRFPRKLNAGRQDQRLISFVDFRPTLLSMVGIEPPKVMQGQAFEGKFRSTEPRKYVHAAADRFDECHDMIRAVRDSRFKYLRNFYPERPYYLPISYREQMSSMKELLRLRDSKELNESQMQWFRTQKPKEELFDTVKDPFELQNLADDPAYTKKLTELRTECELWMGKIDDKGFVPEEQLIRQFWPGKIQPMTATPVVTVTRGTMVVSCASEGASIGFEYTGESKKGLGGSSYRVYDQPVQLQKGQQVKVIAHRLGYAPSALVTVSYN